MMKPDLKVTIAYGTETQFRLAEMIKKKYDELHKHGYPVNARLITSDGSGISIPQRAVEEFSDFDYAIFLFGIKSVDIIPSDRETVKIPNNKIKCALKRMFKDKAATIEPKLSQNMIYELGFAKATHNDPNSIIWFSYGGNITKSFPTDIAIPSIIPLDNILTDEDRVDCVFSTLHKIIKKSINYLGENYNDKIFHILFKSDYRPSLSKLVSRKNFDIDFFGSNNSSLDVYFEKEYNFFNEDISKFNLARRIQYLADRAVLFVYLRNNQLWANKVYELFEACEDIREENEQYHICNLAISVLKQVMLYHKMMVNDEVKYSHIFFELNRASENSMLINSMLRCLCFDYKGLCAHKMSLEQFSAENKDILLNVKSKEDLDLFLNSINESEKKEAKKHLIIAIESFDIVLRVSNESSMENSYLWEGFALYNRARCKYILNVLYPDSDDWEEDMDAAIRIRGEYADRYRAIKSFPAIISHNLLAEYFHAKLERQFYIAAHKPSKFNKEEFEKLKQEITKWKNKSLFHIDVLSVADKLKKI